MNIIVISRPNGQPVRRSLHAPRHFLALGAVTAVTIAAAVGAGYAIGRWQQAGAYVSAWQARLASQHNALARVREKSHNEIEALSVELAELQSRMTRIDALGRRLIKTSGVDADEFDFSSVPGRGGPHPSASPFGAVGQQRLPDLWSSIDTLGDRMRDRKQQLGVLADVLMERKLAAASIPSGWPVDKGWMSSPYGHRLDPFTGADDWHEGIDFAAHAGTPVHAVGAGVVTYAGKRWGYGNLVEITHSDGYITRYGHNSKILVEVGDMVRRGDVIAQVGSTGHSTGPHVHLEVIRNGKVINPLEFVQAKR